MTTIQNHSEYTELVNRMKVWGSAYALYGRREISDNEWDAHYFALKDYEQRTGDVLADSPTQHLADDVLKGRAVARRQACLSMDREYTVEDICKWMAKQTKKVTKATGKTSVEFDCEWKYDGVTAVLEYSYGTLTGASFGHGKDLVGTDFMAHAQHIQCIPKKVYEWAELGHVEVRGEVVCSKQNLRYVHGKAKNCLEAVKNALAYVTPSEHDCSLFEFIAFDAYGLGETYRPTIKDLLARNTFRTAESPILHGDGSEVRDSISSERTLEPSPCKIYAAGEAQREAFPYPTDGLVIKLRDMADYQYATGTKSHHGFNVALKYMTADMMATTIYRGYKITENDAVMALYDDVVINSKHFSTSRTRQDVVDALTPGQQITVAISGGAGGAFIYKTMEEASLTTGDASLTTDNGQRTTDEDVLTTDNGQQTTNEEPVVEVTESPLFHDDEPVVIEWEVNHSSQRRSARRAYEPSKPRKTNKKRNHRMADETVEQYKQRILRETGELPTAMPDDSTDNGQTSRNVIACLVCVLLVLGIGTLAFAGLGAAIFFTPLLAGALKA